MKSSRFESSPRWLLWGLAFPLGFLNIWLVLLAMQYLQPIVSIVGTAALLAFVLSYPVQLLEQRGVRRGYAIPGVFLLALVLLIGAAVIVVPIVLGQLNELAGGLPTWIELSTDRLRDIQQWAVARKVPFELSNSLSRLLDQVSGQIQSLSGTALGVALDTVSSVVNLVLTIVLTFYLLTGGEQLWTGLSRWLPPQQGSRLLDALRLNFQNYVLAQVTLAGLIGLAMTVVFLALQVPFGFLFGIGIGLMTLIPFGVGASITVVSLILAFQDFWLGARVYVIATLVDQVVENGVAPRILGRFTGLNPVWILVALLLGAKVGGLLGLLVAVPLAGFVKSVADSLWNGNGSAPMLTGLGGSER